VTMSFSMAHEAIRKCNPEIEYAQDSLAYCNWINEIYTLMFDTDNNSDGMEW